MNKYIFLTNEGFTFQPFSESLEPDVDNMQVIGFSQGYTAKDAFNRLLGTNPFLKDTGFDEVFSLQLAGDDREYFRLHTYSNTGKAAQS